MDPAYWVIGSLLIAGILFGSFRRRPEKRGRGGWIGLGLILLFVAGLVISGLSGREGGVWFFGLGLMFLVPILFLLAVGSEIGSFFRRR